MNTKSILTASAAVFCALTATAAHADTFGPAGPNQFTIDFVNIGNAGNTDDLGAGGGLYSTPYGGVAYAYRMGTFEISQDQITKATAGGLAGVVAGAHTGNEPAANITWFEAAAFVNWLNDQRTPGLKAYNLTGVSSLTPWESVDAWQVGGENLYRHKDAYYFLPSEDEWYKAAYHKNDGVTANYWDYATGSNTIPTQVLTDGTTPFTAIFDGPEAGVPADPADVNLAGGLSAYGTMGQNGNVYEWAESAADGLNNSSSENRAVRGGDWGSVGSGLCSSGRNVFTPLGSIIDVGFRVASVPEPTAAALLLGTALPLLLRRRRNSVRRARNLIPSSRESVAKNNIRLTFSILAAGFFASTMAIQADLVLLSGGSGSYDLSNASSNVAAARAAILAASFGGQSAQIASVDSSDQVAMTAALLTADVYIRGAVGGDLTTAESVTLNSFLQGGGGIVIFGNSGFDWAGQIVGDLGTLTGRNHFGGVSLQAGSPLGSGAGGTVATGTSTINSFGVDASGAYISSSGGIVGLRTNSTVDALAATWDLPSGGRLVVFGDEEIFKSQGSGGDNRWNGTHQAYLLNAIDFASNASAIPEPSLGVAALLISSAAWFSHRRRRSCS